MEIKNNPRKKDKKERGDKFYLVLKAIEAAIFAFAFWRLYFAFLDWLVK